ncbi:LuxR family transcriptional regulator [Mesobacterium sp. TK19101]|uniref:LuxR family transcriptional regulator n=1 Tax=Mesobacterium hydrothermale TaxID=3111907 RepID=A0ABU6HCT4_9RHOB|nr:LuxR family transcriptional regulator [Mesobacterium sp. TK19101]MEC3860272.1 LuxR family transcriptional regulator [Mesobacterium sp. TK19101]
MQLIDLAERADDENRFDLYLAQLCEEFELDDASYATTNLLTGDVTGYATYRMDWRQHYGELGLHEIDPTLYQSARSVAPVDWSRFRRDDSFAKVFENARDFGITDRGLTVPVRGPYGDCGLLSITRDCGDDEWAKLKAKIMGNLQMAAVHIHDAVASSGLLFSTLGRTSLSSREAEILQWIAMGKTQSEIGDLLTISTRTVEVHLRSARTKLSALTTPQAVGRGILYGIIEPG